ncbi:UNVERIFIED_CONTAM: hypothetical protein PYX00_010550 [Menopon gallinae]|uniref:RDD domain-containing protein n=1 Tax=Menopon gallinae TaxID=328185 RepID=A0AAW2HFT0_9NEOP
MSQKDFDAGAPLGAGARMRRGVGTISKSQINKEYFQRLEQWLNDVRSYTFSCYFCNGLPYSMMSQPTTCPPNGTFSQPTNFVPPAPPLNQDIGMFVYPRPQQPQPVQEQGMEYKIPPLWKRFAAEFVDFILLFLMKLAITFIAVDFFDFVDLDDIEILQKRHIEMDYRHAIEMTSGIIFLELIHRLIVCIYECIFLRRGAQNQIGGATPGKSLMGIKVVLCYNVQQVGNDTNMVKVIPATNLGLGWSLARAVLKNIVLALLFPFFLPIFLNKFHRTSYDILCNSIVVEERLE